MNRVAPGEWGWPQKLDDPDTFIAFPSVAGKAINWLVSAEGRVSKPWEIAGK